MDNSTLIKIGTIVIVLFILMLFYLIIKKLSGGSIEIDKESIYDMIRR